MLKKLQQLWALQEQSWHLRSFIMPQVFEILRSRNHQSNSQILLVVIVVCLAQLVYSTFAISQEQSVTTSQLHGNSVC